MQRVDHEDTKDFWLQSCLSLVSFAVSGWKQDDMTPYLSKKEYCSKVFCKKLRFGRVGFVFDTISIDMLQKSQIFTLLNYLLGYRLCKSLTIISVY